MPRINAGDVNLHYRQLGMGPDVVMIHGLGANVAFWLLGSGPLLARRSHVLAYDLRGHGHSDMTRRGYSFASMANDLRNLLDALSIDSADLVAHSFGAGVALELACTHPERVRRLILADPRVASLHPDADHGSWTRHLGQWLSEVGINVPPSALIDEHRLLEYLADPERIANRQSTVAGAALLPFGLWNGSQRGAEQWRRVVSSTDALEEILGDSDLTPERVARLQQPTLLLLGGRSRDQGEAATLSEILPNARTGIVRGAGHFHPFVRPKAFAARVQAFRSGQASRVAVR